MKHQRYSLHPLLIVFILAISSLNDCKSTELAEVGEVFEIRDNNFEGFSDVWGMIRGSENPWIHSLQFGWIYLDPHSKASGYWVWIGNLGWIYSSAGQFPEVYMLAKESWGFLDLTCQVGIKVWNFKERVWNTYSKPGSSSFETFGEVPKELQGIQSTSSGNKSGSGISIGSYYLSMWYSDPWNRTLGVYYYNKNDDWFYPLHGAGGSDGLGYKFISYTMTLYEYRRIKVRVEGDNVILHWNDRIWNNEDTEEVYPINSQK